MGRYLEMPASELDFGSKSRNKRYAVAEGGENVKKRNSIETSDHEMHHSAEVNEHEDTNDNSQSYVMMEVVDEDGFVPNVESTLTDKEAATMGLIVKEVEASESIDTNGELKRGLKLESEKEKLVKAVSKLTLNPHHKTDHRSDLVNSAKLLNDARNKLDDNDIEDVDLERFKSNIRGARNIPEVLQSLKAFPQLQIQISELEQSKLLEQLLRISSLPNNPLTSFPFDINTNHYSEIVNFALKHAPDVLDFVIKICVKNEAPIEVTDVIRVAYMFSSLASAMSCKNNAMKKTKSISTKTNGLTNAGLDDLAHTGIFETSRSWRNDRDLLASLSEEILKAHAKFFVPQITFDNMDLTIANVMHHMTLPFLEFETIDTSHLSKENKTFEEALEYFELKTVDITSDFNKDLYDHFKYVTAWTLGRIFGKRVPGFSWFLQVFPKHYRHPNSDNAGTKSHIFTQKPLNYSENSNADMIRIMEILQRQYLSYVGEQVGESEKEVYEKDLKVIYSVDGDKSVRFEAEQRVKEVVSKAGELICHGDLLTEVRFEACKRLRRLCVTAVERFDFLRVFRLGTFHLRMNKTIQDLAAGMKSVINVDDILSLGFFRTILGLNNISNEADFIKKDGNYEAHAQFCDEVGTELLIEAFNTYAGKKNFSGVSKTEQFGVQLILNFLDKSGIQFYFDPKKTEDPVEFDDMLAACRDNAGRTVLSLVLKAVEKEADGLGLRALRTVMIPYFLNRKENVQDSKYAARLLSNRIAFLQSSPRTQARIDNLACCNPSGKLGRAIARDQQNEHKVKTTKMTLKGLHSQLTELTVEKSTLGSNILEIVEDHDRQAMLLQEEGGRSSHRYLSDAQTMKIEAEIKRMKPFDLNREKVEFYDKARGMFSGLDVEQVDRFILRNQSNFKRNSPHRNINLTKELEAAAMTLDIDNLGV